MSAPGGGEPTSNPSPLVGEGGEGGEVKREHECCFPVSRPPPLTPPHNGEGKHSE